jgi:rod shape-determining protein MreC
MTSGLRAPLAVILAVASVGLALLDRSGVANRVLEPARGAARSALAPVESAVDGGVRQLEDTMAGLARGGKMAAENARLRRELEIARVDFARAEALAEENGRLSELLGMPAISGLRTIPARVVSVGIGRPGATLLLDRGRDAGVAPGMPVTAGGALIGRVIQVWSSTAAVLPVTDPASAVGVRLSGSGVLAVAEGRGRGTVLRLEPLDPSSTPAPDETAVTAGLRHGLYPAGLVVGRAAGGDGLRLLTGLDRLHFVQVLDWRPPR